MRSLNLQPVEGFTGVWLILMGFAMGIVMIWIYAAIRPRFGAGPKTAIYAGLATWLLVYVFAYGWQFLLGVYPARIYLITIAWTFIETPLASIAGAWLYKE